jgi:putative endonuclease
VCVAPHELCTGGSERAPMKPNPRVAAHKRADGDRAEDLAAEAMLAAGYQIVSRNTRVGSSEIDIVAADGDITCFVEVRKRATIDDALSSIDGAKRKQLVRAAQAWMVKFGEVRCRFDVVAVSSTDAVKIIKDAYRPW